jgi:hypothetical protein
MKQFANTFFLSASFISMLVIGKELTKKETIKDLESASNKLQKCHEVITRSGK